MKLFILLVSLTAVHAYGGPSHRAEHSVRAYIRSEMKEPNGHFTLTDREAGRIRKLTLTDTKAIATDKDGHSQVRAKFLDKNGDDVDVDFTLDPNHQVETVTIHRVNGELRAEE